MLAIAVDYYCLLNFLYKCHDSLSVLHGITSSDQPRLDGWVDGKGPSTLLSFSLYKVDIIVVV